MREAYSPSNFYMQEVSLVKYFAIFYSSILPIFLRGVVLKTTMFYLVLESAMLHFCIMFLKFNFVSNVRALLDIVVVDYPVRLENRFEIVYAFWNVNLNLRIFIKTFANTVSPIFSIHTFFSSASWLEREV